MSEKTVPKKRKKSPDSKKRSPKIISPKPKAPLPKNPPPKATPPKTTPPKIGKLTSQKTDVKKSITKKDVKPLSAQAKKASEYPFELFTNPEPIPKKVSPLKRLFSKSTKVKPTTPFVSPKKDHVIADEKTVITHAEVKKGGHLIAVENLHKNFGKKEAVRGVSFNITSGEVVGFLGPNGAGKTTVFYMIVGFLTPTKGSITFDNEKINKLSMYKRARRGISYLPQESSVFRHLTVEQNIVAVLQTISEMSQTQRKNRLENLLSEFGLQKVRKQKAYTLSGGERRRTEIARGMAIDPYFLLLDEPFTGIDPKARFELKQIIASVAKKNVGVLITDHNERDTLSITNRAFIVHEGKIVVAGSREEIMNDTTAREIYLGEDYSSE